MARDQLNIPIIAVSRSGDTREQLLERVRNSLTEHGDFNQDTFDKLSGLIRQVDGDYADITTFRKLKKELKDAKRPIHYLAIPPSLFETVIDSLAEVGCAQNARVIVEKPFGRDLASARELNAALHKAFDESSVFRIDHYLGKEAILGLSYFRFANTFLEPIWNRLYIDSVQITMARTSAWRAAAPLRGGRRDPRRRPEPHAAGAGDGGHGTAVRTGHRGSAR